MSTPDFDATGVDPATVELAGAGVRVVGKRGKLVVAAELVNDDDLLDLVVHIETSALQLTVNDTEAVLTGETFDGIPIRGSDSVRIVP